MRAFLNILGGIFIIVGIVWIISIVVAVANHSADYSTMTQLIIPIAIHAACDMVGIILIGAAMRLKKTTSAV